MTRVALLMAICVISGRGDEVRLRDGGVIEVDAVWERDGAVWYRQGQLIASLPKAEVSCWNCPPPEPAKPQTRYRRSKSPVRSAAKPAEVVAGQAADSKSGGQPSPTVTRLQLRDGTLIDVDEAWESGEQLGYRMGGMRAFVERGEVARVLRGAAVEEQTPAVNLNFTTGHRGLDQLIASSAAKNDLDPLLVYFVMREESGFNHRAVSRAGARGLMQLMPATARRLGVRNIHDPRENVEAGARYLRDLVGRFSGDVRLALAAYNAGEEAVARYGNQIPPYRETLGYVRRISAAYWRARTGGAAMGEPSQAAQD